MSLGVRAALQSYFCPSGTERNVPLHFFIRLQSRGPYRFITEMTPCDFLST